jgi:hypothetical protein
MRGLSHGVPNNGRFFSSIDVSNQKKQLKNLSVVDEYLNLSLISQKN